MAFSRRILWLLTASMTGVTTITFGAGLIFWILTPNDVAVYKQLPQTPRSLKHDFAFQEASYLELKNPEFLKLESSPSRISVPDLRNILTYHGINGRPDSSLDRPLLHFSLTGGKASVHIGIQERLYLTFDNKAQGASFQFSPSNKPSPLWIEPEIEGQEAHVRLFLEDPEGKQIEGLAQLHSFKLPEKEWVKKPTTGTASTWEIGKWKVDATFLARQQARWWGPDRFLEKHGGDDFEQTLGKHRIDFSDGEDTSSVFLDVNSCLVWNGKKWQEVKPGPNSYGKPLLHVKKIEERLMHLELWDESGQRKMPFTLLRAQEVWAKDELQKEFKFIGARTRSTCVFEIQGEKMFLKPHDWLLLTDDGWKKLENEKEIDDYVARRITGSLFVFDGIIKKDEHQVLTGTLFNPARTETQELELALNKGGVTVIPSEPGAAAQPPLHLGRSHKSLIREIP